MQHQYSTNANLNQEVIAAIEGGMCLVTPREYDASIEALGYVRDKSMRCASIARNMTTGNSFPNVTFGAKERDTGRSAFHFESRRDENFKKFQEYRLSHFCIVRNSWWEI